MHTTEREVRVAEAVLDMAARTEQSDVLGLLHDLTTHLVILCGLRGAGTTILDEAGRVDYLTASDEMCRSLEEEQRDLDEGPCVDSTRAGAALAPVMLGPGSVGALRWPRFAPRALREGITWVASVPLRAGTNTVGAVNLMGADPGALDARAMRLAQILADAAGAWLVQRQLQRTKDELIEQLQTALDTRIVIEQAKGVLAAKLGVDVHEAFNRLRGYARSQREKLGDVATRVANGSIPPELQARAER
ncbi:ANTAR domain-containing protein [Streptomyces sp. NPDC102365]|uniref:ANTAR domain-containing protein n=1 Tax=Streptomyces sp. NPDC102365 TaxID=3366162 RepID=UPI00380A7528